MTDAGRCMKIIFATIGGVGHSKQI